MWSRIPRTAFTPRTLLAVLVTVTLSTLVIFRDTWLAEYRSVSVWTVDELIRNINRIETFTHSDLMRLYNIDDEQDQRKRHLASVCSRPDPFAYLRGSNIRNMKQNYFLDQTHRLYYCKIEKVGSTFLTTILSELRQAHLDNIRKTNMTLHVRRRIVSKGIAPVSDLQHINFYELHKAIMGSFRFLFVREPYGRLLSGYVDKFFMPNTLFWKTIGTRALSVLRHKQVQCGYNMSFSEFIRYVIFAEQTGEHTDTHFTTMNTHCEPCKLSYDFIGKLETFKPDVMTLLRTWNKLYGANITFNDFDSETAYNRAMSYAQRLYEMQDDIEKCAPFYVGMKNTWIGLQLQGIIPKFDSFPFSESQAAGVSLQRFQAAIHHVLGRITDKAALKRQRQEALIEAYSLVPTELLVILREIIRPDCEAFGYDSSPDYIFDTGHPRQKDLRFFKL